MVPLPSIDAIVDYMSDYTATHDLTTEQTREVAQIMRGYLREDLMMFYGDDAMDRLSEHLAYFDLAEVGYE